MRQAWPKATSGTAQDARQRRPARLGRLAVQIDPVKLQQIESVQEGLARALAAHGSARPVEVSHTIWPADHTLTVDGNRSDRASNASAITGARSLWSMPHRESTRNRSPSRRHMNRKPSCFIS